MNNARVAQLLRQLADEIMGMSTPSVPRNSVARSYGQEEVLKDVLPEEDWERFDITMRFGKHAGESLLNIPTSYLNYLGSQDFEGRGDDLGNRIEEAIRFLADEDPGVDDEPEPPRRPMQRAVTAEPDDFEDNVPF